MPKASYKKLIPAPVTAVWAFMSKTDNWAPFFEGYQSHETVSPEESVWRIIGRAGPLSRALAMRVRVTEWAEPTRVTFTLSGVDEKVDGRGLFLTRPEGEGTQLVFELELVAGGEIGPMVNAFLGPVLRRISATLVDRISEAMSAGGANGYESVSKVG